MHKSTQLKPTMKRTTINRFHKRTRLPRWQRVTVWPLQIVAAASFFVAGTAKLIGTEDMVRLFEGIGWGQLKLFDDFGWSQWFRHLTGSLQIFSAVLLLFPDRAFWGGLLQASFMVGAILIHLMLGGSLVPALVLLSITTTVAWFRRSPSSKDLDLRIVPGNPRR